MRHAPDLARRAGLLLLQAAGVLLVAVLLVALIVAALRGDPSRALAALYRGALGSPDSVVETLIRSTPLMLTGLGVAVAFRCGIWNIGAEGQLLVGMLGSALAALLLPPLPPLLGIPVCLLAGAAAGGAWAALAALLKLKRDVPEVISTIMLNFLAIYLIEYLVRGPLKDPASASDWSSPLPDWSRLPRLNRLPLALSPEWGRLHLGVFLALLVAGAVWLWLSRTGTGFRIRAVGLNPGAAAAAGISLGGTLFVAFVTSGALAGLGGAVEQLAVISRLHRYMPGEPGYGFSGIAVALLGRLHPAGAVAAALFFGALAAGCDQMQRSAGISFQVAYVVQASVVLLLLAVPRLRQHRRKDEGSGALPG
jgi:simple sugar transport system permease protein